MKGKSGGEGSRRGHCEVSESKSLLLVTSGGGGGAGGMLLSPHDKVMSCLSLALMSSCPALL